MDQSLRGRTYPIRGERDARGAGKIHRVSDSYLPVRGAAHIVAKTQQHHNGPNTFKRPGNMATEEGGEGSAVEEEEEGIGGMQGDEAKYPPHSPCRISDQHEEGHKATGSGAYTEAEEEERHKEEENRDGETPQGATVEVTRVEGNMPPPEEKAYLP